MSAAVEQAVLDRIAKLLALGENNPNEHEAAAAMAAASRLMERHKIDAASVRESALDQADAAPEDVDDTVLDADLASRLPTWLSVLSGRIAIANGCSTYINPVWDSATRSQKMRLHILGTRTDAATARYMYMYARRQIDAACEEAAERNGRPGRSWCANFRVAAAQRVGARIIDASRLARKQEETAAVARGVTSTALALVSDDRDRIALAIKAKEKSLGLRSRGGGGGMSYDHHAREEGRRAGDRVDISPGGRASLGSGRRAIGGVR